ncbi:hypothetical protein [Plantibacter sp. YIM 135249]|uniref:hypothetical protein n=1 Tax=Plantibacter sp. YIM 135249 TaxID=3423918 RepID=UPI003D340EBE
MSTPFTADDLRRVAKSLEEWERLLIKRGTGEYAPRAELITRIEVTRPDGGDEVIGHFVLDDGWLGFAFKGGAS